ncbi:MAG: hypothetical protein H6Q79_164 [Deltaproteobacteria bacterium]|nr:hypothetical protein [Deltaproteobacteria bacterium]MBP2682125.1 hypothetical protein [Deltaproteobacteria bacterium]
MKYVKGSPRSDEYEKLLIWEYFGFATEGYFVEVGAHHPKRLSQTWLLEKVGWKGILIEPLPEYCALLRRERPSAVICQVAVSAPGKTGVADFFVSSDLSTLDPKIRNLREQFGSVIQVDVTTVDNLLERETPSRVDFVSIDTEGTELDVLKGFDVSRYRPSLILLEDSVYTLDLHEHLLGQRYKLVRRTGINNWYIPREKPFHVPLAERARLFRKMRLGTPLRAWRFRRAAEETGTSGR